MKGSAPAVKLEGRDLVQRTRLDLVAAFRAADQVGNDLLPKVRSFAPGLAAGVAAPEPPRAE